MNKWLQQLASGTEADWIAWGVPPVDRQLVIVDVGGVKHLRLGDGVTLAENLPNVAEKGDTGDPGAPGTTQTGAEIVAAIDAEIGTGWQTGGGGGASPTQTVVSLSGASTSIPIPAGCSVFEFRGVITPSVSIAVISPRLFNTGDTVNQLVSGKAVTTATAALGGVAVGLDAFGVSAGSGARAVSGRITGARNGVIRTFTTWESMPAGTPQHTHWSCAADAAADDDTFRIEVDTGTMSGEIVITWF